MNCYIASNQEEYSWLTTLTMCLCYSLGLYTCKNIIEDYITNMSTETNRDTKSNSNTNNVLRELTKLPNFTLSSIKDSHNDEYKQKMFKELLDINSLDRCYILYFIFKRKGEFKSIISSDYINNELTSILINSNIYTNTNTNTNTEVDEEQEKVVFEESESESEAEESESTESTLPTESTPLPTPDNTTDTTSNLETYNSYDLYNKIINKLNLDLDESSIPDIQIQIGDNNYELTGEKLNFIQWIYYIGLYDYLIDINNIDIKYDILNEMDELSLLTGNLFLRYQLFLCDYEYEKNKK